jgi:DNA polymerase-3 subunit alpha (Gram-positive type)
MGSWDAFVAGHPALAELGPLAVQEVVWSEGGSVLVRISSPEPWSPAARSAAEAFLSEALGAPVEVAVAVAQAIDPVERLLAADTPLQRWLPPDAVTWRDGALHLCFPSPGVREVFDGWGGVDRLRRLVPDLPPVVVSAKPAPPLPPDEVASPPPERLARLRWGRGAPDGDPTSLDHLAEGDTIVVQGRLFQVERRSSAQGGAVWLAGLSDGQRAVRVKVFSRRGEDTLDERFADGLFIKARGLVETDRSGEVAVRLTDGGEVDPPTLDDGAPVPRVEWHCHTKMSAMDGLVDVEDAFRLAAELGHPALAVVDHGVVQAYPEAARLAEQYGVRPLYGLEAYVVPDVLRPFRGRRPTGLPREVPLVAVDIETTGLSPRVHEIVELGAARIEGGEVTERFQRLVKPSRALSQASRRITGIQDRELVAAPPAEEVFAEFRAFAAGAVLVAHNAAFDWGFLRPWLDADTPVADTLALARVLLPDQKAYGLEQLAELFHIPLTEHHRALHDAEAAGRLWAHLWAIPAAHDWSVDPDWWAQARPVHWRVSRPVPVLVYPRHQAGLEALYEAVSKSHLEHFWRVPRLLWSEVAAHRHEWLVGCPLDDGELAELLFRRAPDDEWEGALARYDFVEVGPPARLKAWWDDGALGSREEVERLLTELVERAQAAGKPVVASSDVHYLRPEQARLRDVLRVTAKGELHAGESALHFRTTGEMLEEMAFLGPDRARQVVVEASHALLAGMDPAIKPVPDGLHAPVIPEAERVVSERPWVVARERFGDPLPALVADRLSREIDAIVRHGFASVYYTAHRLVEKSLADGYLVGSRGSVGSSLVATYLNITEVNPLPPHYRCPNCRYWQFFTHGEVGSGFDLPPQPCPHCGELLVGDGQDIPFETFLGFEGDKVPDIDLNFSGEYQPVIHRYTEELFGSGYVYRAGTIATVADRTAFGLVKAWARETGRDLRPVEVDQLAEGLRGVKRTTGQHPGGLMVVPEGERIHRFTPLQRPADAQDTDVVTTHFDYHAIEGRLLKLDLLGHEDPTSLRLLADLTGIDPRSVPFQDADTMALFSGLESLGLSPEALGTPVGTLGIPEFGTPFVRRMLAETRPRTFAELVRISGLSHGTNVWVSNAEELIRSGRANLSQVIATRDDIMTYLIRQGVPEREAFGVSERVRRGRGLTTEQEQMLREAGVPEWYVDSCRRITYLFPKAHAAAYVTMGWRIAWFKVHRPLAFYAVYCTVRGDDFVPEVALGGLEAIDRERRRIEGLGTQASPKERSQLSLLEVLKEMALRGFGFRPVSLMLSHPTRFQPAGERDLLMPFVALPGLGRAAAESIAEARQAGPFLSVDDLRQRARLSRTVLDLLRQHGALDGLGETRQLAFF